MELNQRRYCERETCVIFNAGCDGAPVAENLGMAFVSPAFCVKQKGIFLKISVLDRGRSYMRKLTKSELEQARNDVAFSLEGDTESLSEEEVGRILADAKEKYFASLFAEPQAPADQEEK